MMVARSNWSQSFCSFWEPPEVRVGLGTQHAEKPVKCSVEGMGIPCQKK